MAELLLQAVRNVEQLIHAPLQAHQVIAHDKVGSCGGDVLPEAVKNKVVFHTHKLMRRSPPSSTLC